MIECCADLAAMPPHGDYEAKRWPGGFGAINQWGGPPPPRFLLAGLPIANVSPTGVAAMKLRRTAAGLIARAEDGRWVALPGETDLVAFLTRRRGRAGRRARRRSRQAAGSGATAVDPGERDPALPAALDARLHALGVALIASARMLVKHFFPPPAAKVVAGFERVTGRTFPKLKPNKRFYETPTFYVANHAAVLADGEEMWWPSHTKYLDFELELAFVLAKPLADATPEEAAAAVGGWFVAQRLERPRRPGRGRCARTSSARWSSRRPSPTRSVPTSSPPTRCRTGTRRRGRVRVDGELWCEGATAGAAHDVGAMLAYASAGERLEPGDVISTGTMPGCCGLELDRWIQPGQTVELEIDGIGTLANRISPTAGP